MKLRHARRVLVVAAGLLALVGQSTAHAASVQVTGAELVFTAGAGESNALSISFGDGAYEVQDNGTSGEARVVVQPGPGCLPGSSPGTIVCSGAGVSAVVADMGDADDSATLNITTPASLSGREGVDNLTGGGGADSVSGGAGNDTLNGGEGGDVLDAGAGDDSADGGGGGDALAGGAGVDTLTGGAGDDALDGGSGADVLQGGDGRDAADYSGRSDPVSLTLDVEPNDGANGEGDRIASDVEDLRGGAGDDTLTGNDQPNTLDGGGGDDSIDGALGSDTLRGDAGDDLLTGGSADDLLSGGDGDDGLAGGQGADVQLGGPGSDFAGYIGRTGSVTVTIDEVANDGQSGEGDNVLGDVEGLYGGEANDLLTGSGADNIVVGGGGNDIVDGAGGNDLVTGNAGADEIRGGEGNDFVSFDEPGPVSLSLDGLANDGLPGEADNVTGDVENLVGTSGTDTITGDDRANTLVGDAGADSIVGGGGFDVFDGGDGDDTIDSRDGGGPDALQCGAGDDVAQIDSLDAVDDSCEHVLAAAAFQFAKRGLVASREGIVRVSISCPAQAIGGCNGRLALSLADRRLGRKGAIRVASGKVRVKKSDTGAARLKLSRNDTRVLAGLRKTTAVLTLIQDDGAGHTATIKGRTRLAIAPKPQPRKKKR